MKILLLQAEIMKKLKHSTKEDIRKVFGPFRSKMNKKLMAQEVTK